MISVRWCFNGAAPARARNELGARCNARRLGSASTGPRPRGRGMQRRARMLHAAGGFNGAAPARARNVFGRSAARIHKLLCFNGAAPARARNAANGKRNLVMQMLQRGRARAGAEWCQCRRIRISMPASTGPRPRGRGIMHSGSDRCDASAALQRGRARAGAECSDGRTSHGERRLTGFNGAAPARARNVDSAM